MDAPHASQQRVAIDLGFDQYMAPKDIKKLCKQLGNSYSANRYGSPLQLYMTGFDDAYRQRVKDYQAWDVGSNVHSCNSSPSSCL